MNKHPTVRKQTPNINKYQHLTLFAFRLVVFQYFTTTCTLCLSYRQILVMSFDFLRTDLNIGSAFLCNTHNK